MLTTKTYESLQDLNSSANAGYGKGPAVKIIQCSALLPNHMQCWRASDVLITSETPAPTEDNPNAVSRTQTQMCNRHAVMDQQGYLKTQQDQEAVTAAQAQVEADSNPSASNTPNKADVQKTTPPVVTSATAIKK